MAKNHCISGVNWASLKKFARFVFGDKNVVGTRIVDDRYYIIYIDKKVYDENPQTVEKFEDKFLVSIKGQE